LWWLKGDVVFGKRMHVQGGRVFEMAGREVGDRSGDGRVCGLGGNRCGCGCGSRGNVDRTTERENTRKRMLRGENGREKKNGRVHVNKRQRI